MPSYTDIHSTGLADKLAGEAMFLENASVVLTVCSDDMAQLTVNGHGVPDPYRRTQTEM
jgi:hypothetical protein